MKFVVIIKHIDQCGWHNATCPHPTVALAQDEFDRWWGFCDIHARTITWGTINGGDVDTSAVDVSDLPEAEQSPPSLSKGSIYY